MSEEQHEKDIAEGLIKHHVSTASNGSGGKCLCRHNGKTPEKGENISCSHRWQAYERMRSDEKLYDWPKYEVLSKFKSRIRTARKLGKKSGKMFPRTYLTTLKQPKEFEWDVGDKQPEKKNNFKKRCFDPYWHEANHIVPNSTLANSIADVAAGGYEYTIRWGLYKEGYNLNYKKNMIMLPMDRSVARALELPRHRQTASHRSHKAYSKNIRNQLDDIVAEIAEKLVKHKARSYKNMRAKIENISKTTYGKIRDSVKITKTPTKSLDEMESSEF